MALPLHLLLVIFADWVSRQQQSVIEYLQAENEVVKSQQKGRRITLTDDERRKLAVKGKALGRKLLSEAACIVTSDTILAWHRRLVAAKCTFRRRTQERPPLADEVCALIVESARNDSNWGYRSIRDRLANLRHRVSRSTIASVLKEHGIDPAPKRRRRTSWTTFIKAHWPSLAAIDFTTGEVWTKGIGDLLPSVRHGSGESKSHLRRDHTASGDHVDAAGRTQPYRCIQRFSASPHGPGRFVQRHLPGATRKRRHSPGPSAGTVAQLQRPLGAIPWLIQKGGCGSNDFFRRRAPAMCGRRVSQVLPP